VTEDFRPRGNTNGGKCNDYRRRGAIDQRARRRLGLTLAYDEPLAFEEAEERLEAASRYHAVRERLHELPEDQRAALELRVVDELD